VIHAHDLGAAGLERLVADGDAQINETHAAPPRGRLMTLVF
jgi:hypothetical protein